MEALYGRDIPIDHAGEADCETECSTCHNKIKKGQFYHRIGNEINCRMCDR